MVRRTDTALMTLKDCELKQGKSTLCVQFSVYQRSQVNL